MVKHYISTKILQKKINIVFVLPSLIAGGAERVITLIATNINPKIFNVTLIVIGFEKDKAYNVNGINVMYLNKSRVLTGIPKLIKHMLKIKPQLVVSCMSHVNIVMALILILFPKIKLIIREANIKKVTEIYNKKRTYFSRVLLKISHLRAYTIICQSKDMAEELQNEFNVKRSKIVVINNPVSDEFTLKNKINNKVPHYITVGRLHNEKGHLRLLNILSKLKYDFKYTIIGNGPHKNEILEAEESLNLKSKISHIDYTNDVNSYLKQSDVFLQGSYAEGFPNALLESCAVGTPVIAFNVLGGTKEIVENKINGYLVENEFEFLEKLNALYNSFEFDSKTVRQSIIKKFNKTFIISTYESVFLNAINCPK